MHRSEFPGRLVRGVVAVFAAILVAMPTAAWADPTGVDAPVSTADLVAQGGTISPDGQWVVMPDGAAVSVEPMALSDCPSGVVCLFNDANFGGTVVKLSLAGDYNLTNYGFNDRMSSWANTSGRDARWFYDVGPSGTNRCMNAYTNNSYVGATDNDKASAIRIYSTSTAC